MKSNIVEKQVQIVLLPTENQSRICLIDNKILDYGSNVKLEPHITICKNQNLHIVSDEITEVGDWFLYKNKWIHKCKYKIQEDLYDENDIQYFDFDCKKIIATTDKIILESNHLLIKFPNFIYKIFPYSILRYINYYNKNKTLTDIIVRYKEKGKNINIFKIK